MPFAIPLAAILGLSVGSFLNVVAWRLPRGESLSHPGSHCPNCGSAVRPYDNVPVISWILLRARCRDCAEPISSRYPLVELLTAALYVAVVVVLWGDAGDIALGIATVTFLVPIAFIDLDTRRIPNKLTGPAAIVALVLVAALATDQLPEHLIAALAAALFFFIPAMINPRGMGMGDVKLAGVMGLFLGGDVGPALLFALVLGAVIGAVIVWRRGMSAGRKTAVPFGPFLALGAVLALFLGDPIVDWYADRY